MAFIVIEGLDGAGKSTQIQLITNHFAQRGIPHRYLHFPRVDAPFFGEMVARFLRGEFGDVNQVDPYIVAMLYAGDRMDAASTIRGWLQQGNLVILDRYVYSNVAFQCAKVDDETERGKLRRWILELEFDYFKIPRPNLNIFLDVPFQFTVQRLSENRRGGDRDYLQGKDDIHEKDLAFQERVRQVYLAQPQHDPTFRVVECSTNSGAMRQPQDIFESILNLVKQGEFL